MIIVLFALGETSVPDRARILALASAASEKRECLLVCRAGSALAREAAARNLPLLTAFGESLFRPVLLGRLLLRLRREGRALLQSFDEPATRFAGLCAGFGKAGTRLRVVTFFSPPGAGVRLRAQRLETADCVVCGSLALAEETGRSSGAGGAALRAIAPGTPADAYAPRQSDRPERFIICMLGSLEEGMGHSMLIRAMAILRRMKELPPWEARLLGSGSLFAALLKEAFALGTADRLAVLGEENLPEVLPQCSALILPFGKLVYAPYLAAGRFTGLPVIGPDLPACREHARPGKDALLIAPDDPHALADAVLRLIREPETARALVAEGARAAAEVGMERMTENFFALYEELLGAAHGD